MILPLTHTLSKVLTLSHTLSKSLTLTHTLSKVLISGIYGTQIRSLPYMRLLPIHEIRILPINETRLLPYMLSTSICSTNICKRWRRFIGFVKI
jgi:hypothetical protein